VKAETTIVTPAEGRGWDVWQRALRGAKLRKSVAMLDELNSSGHQAIVGLPAQECTTLTVTLPTSDESLFGDMVYAQLEKRGLSNGGPQTTVYAYHVIDRQPGESVLSVDVLPHDFSENLCVKEAAGYSSAQRLYPIPDHKVVILKEHDRLVLAAGRHGHMAFSQVLNAGNEFTDALAQEVNLTILSLQGSGQLSDRVGIEVWTDAPREQQLRFINRFTIPVEFVPRPAPDSRLIRHASNPLLPTVVKEAIQRKLKFQRIRLGLLVGLLVYVCAAVALVLAFQQQKKVAEDLDVALAANRPEVEFIQLSQARQHALEPAYDKRLYPMRQLNEIARLMPVSGIVIHKFTTQGQNIRLEGLARDSQIVYQLKADLEKHPEFPGYTWDMGPPQVNQNNTATFRIDGKYATANP